MLHLVPFLLVAFIAFVPLAAASDPADNAKNASNDCLVCHGGGDDSAAATMMASAHGKSSSAEGPFAKEACASCHGASAGHLEKPLVTSPDTSFGPKWVSPVEHQNASCLSCHADNVAKTWQGGTHQQAGRACVDCHDMHVTEDKVVTVTGQPEVCGTCHQVHTDGAHGIHRKMAGNPPCAACHNPHGDTAPRVIDRGQASESCARCHQESAMGPVASKAGLSIAGDSHHAAFHWQLEKVGNAVPGTADGG